MARYAGRPGQPNGWRLRYRESRGRAGLRGTLRVPLPPPLAPRHCSAGIRQGPSARPASGRPRSAAVPSPDLRRRTALPSRLRRHCRTRLRPTFPYRDLTGRRPLAACESSGVAGFARLRKPHFHKLTSTWLTAAELHTYATRVPRVAAGRRSRFRGAGAAWSAWSRTPLRRRRLT